MVAPVDKKVMYFSEKLREGLGWHIRLLYLFGSRARGDAEEGSDYDFMVVVDAAGQPLKEKVLDIEVEFLNEFDQVSSCIVYDEQGWAWRKNSPLGINILREGIRL
jgi:predicted nucleotidyltransferase